MYICWIVDADMERLQSHAARTQAARTAVPVDDLLLPVAWIAANRRYAAFLPKPFDLGPVLDVVKQVLAIAGTQA